MTVTMAAPSTPRGVELSPTQAWSRRVRLVGGLIQVAFAAFWLVRGSLNIAGEVGIALAVVLSVVALAVGGYGLRVGPGVAPMPRGAEAKRIERAVTVATIVQLVASFAAPAIVIAAGHGDWVLPSIAITIGPLLLWLDHLVRIPRYRPVGWALTIGPGDPRSHSVRRDPCGCDRSRGGRTPARHRRRRIPRSGWASPVRKERAAQRATTMTFPAGDSHAAARFRPFFNSATGEHITYTAVPEDNEGEFVRFNWRSVPGGVITEHIHPHQEERFTITAGEARFTLNGQVHFARAGETVVVPAGVPHSEGNAGSVEIEGIVELRPALDAKEWHEALAGMVADGNTDARGAPRNPLQLGATFWHFRDESRVTTPPIWVQNLVLPPLWVLAMALGVRPYYRRWDTRVSDGSPPGDPQLQNVARSPG